MSSSSEKGKSGGKKLSADKQLLALQDVLTSGVSELQLAPWNFWRRKRDFLFFPFQKFLSSFVPN